MLELIESGSRTRCSISRTADLTDATVRLTTVGLTPLRPAHRLDAARADTVPLGHRSGLQLQRIAYDSGSPDLPEGDD
jgi:hypothetical protein